jgi:signal transduction histidine kinase
MGSIRFRLTVIYSVLLFGLAAALVGGLYLGLSRTLQNETVSRTFVVRQPVFTPEGVAIRQDTVRAQFRTLESLVNEHALEKLRTYSFAALAFLFLASLVVGWIVAGRALAPIGRITAVARDIQATDLSRRIALGGPADELRGLADTFDAMLGRLDEAFENQRRFIQEAAHELRNPLAVMRTNLEVALADPDADLEDMRHTATVVSRTVERMGRLVDDLLAHARAGALEHTREPVDLRSLVDETADEFRATAATRRLLLRPVHGADPVDVEGDRTALKQALANLVGNAVRLAPEGSTVTVRAGVEAAALDGDGDTEGATPAGPWATLEVEDEGPGIDPADHDRVFQRFWRGDDQPYDERRSGLGLTIVRQIAESHGGRVSLASERGAGSTFTVRLPLSRLPLAPSS